MASHIAQAPIRQTSNKRRISFPRNNALWQRQHMIVDRPGSGDPDITPPRGDMFQCTAQMPHAMWLTHQIGVERNAHHLRLAIRDLSYPFLEIINNHTREIAGAIFPRDDRGNVIHLLRIGNGEQLSRAGMHPDRRIIHAPNERVAIARFHQHVGRGAAFRNPGGKSCLLMAALLSAIRQFRLALRIGPPMTREFVATGAMRCDQSRRILNMALFNSTVAGSEFHRTDPAAASRRPRDCHNPARRDSAHRDAAHRAPIPHPAPRQRRNVQD